LDTQKNALHAKKINLSLPPSAKNRIMDIFPPRAILLPQKVYSEKFKFGLLDFLGGGGINEVHEVIAREMLYVLENEKNRFGSFLPPLGAKNKTVAILPPFTLYISHRNLS